MHWQGTLSARHGPLASLHARMPCVTDSCQPQQAPGAQKEMCGSVVGHALQVLLCTHMARYRVEQVCCRV